MIKRPDYYIMNPGAAGYNGFHKYMTAIRFQIDGKDIHDMELIELGERGKAAIYLSGASSSPVSLAILLRKRSRRSSTAIIYVYGILSVESGCFLSFSFILAIRVL